jgi:acyl dehydratase
MDTLYLEDLHVGQKFVSGSHTMEPAEIVRFAAEYDPQPFHLDDAAGRETLFGGLVASGWHTAATTMRLIVRGGLPIAGGIIGSGGELLWTTPVRPGDTLHVECEVLEVTPSRSKPDRGTVVARSDTINQHGEIVQTFTARLIVPRRPG